ncbi:hypothetical protein GCM10028808_39570 [Spirosoma migulaei]
MDSEEKDELLDRYAAGHPLNADEEAQVELLLKTDPEFREGYRLRQALFEAGIQQRRVAWEAWQQIHPVPLAPKTMAFPMSWVAAASVALLLGIGLIWWQRTPRTADLITGQAAVFEPQDSQLGLTPSDSVSTYTTWIVTKAENIGYEFAQPDTLHIFSPNPDQWRGKTLQLVRLSEVRYRLRVDRETYLLQQGRTLRLPLEPEK